MNARLAWVLAAGILVGCWPHETRPLTEDEARIVDRMCEAIADHARQSQDPMDEAISQAVDEVRSEGRIFAFEDERRSSGELKQGAVVCGRLYLHSRILAGSDRMKTRDCPFPLKLLYHEGVHLTQSSCLLVFSPAHAEQEAEEKAYRFAEAWSDYRRTFER